VPGARLRLKKIANSLFGLFSALEKGKLVQQGQSETSTSPFMKEFFDEVGDVKNKIGIIKRNIADIGKLHDKALTAIAKSKDDDADLDKLMEDTNALGFKVKNQLKRMEDQNKKNAAEGDKSNLTPAEIRIRVNMHGALTRQFVDVMQKYQEKQEAYKAKIREKVVRQINIVKPDGVSDELMEEYMEGKKQIFTDVIIGSTQQAYEDIKARHTEILKLEESLRELHQLFVDMAVLVEAQGELLDQIENHVSTTVAYTEKGAHELQLANKYQKKSRKKMCFILACATIIVIIVLVVGLKFVGKA